MAGNCSSGRKSGVIHVLLRNLLMLGLIPAPGWIYTKIAFIFLNFGVFQKLEDLGDFEVDFATEIINFADRGKRCFKFLRFI